MTLHGLLPYIELILAIILIVSVLLQQTGASMGGALGGDNFSATYHTRRGLEKQLFYVTIVVGILFAATSLVSLIV